MPRIDGHRFPHPVHPTQTLKDRNETNFGSFSRSETAVKHGKRGLHINCSGLSSSWNKCFAEADKACGTKGYRVIAKSGDAAEEPGDYPFGLNPAGYTSRSMIVICK